jgi:hypothetical protein
MRVNWEKGAKRLAAICATIAMIVTLLAPLRSARAAAGPSTAELANQCADIEFSSSLAAQAALTPADNKFLDDLERRGVAYFMDTADPVTGLMPDRAKADGSAPGDIASIAAVGFGLTAICAGDEHGWISHDEAYQHCLRVLRFMRDRAPGAHGFFYHFLYMRDGSRAWNCEVSDIDTALLLAGALTVRQHFPGTEAAGIANTLYRRAEWAWFLTPDGTLSMDWKPEKGFSKSRWDNFSEGPLIYMLGLGSPTHPLPASSWDAWKRQPIENYAGLTYIQCPALFTHQYPQVWFDLRGLRDDYADYFHNSQLATLAQRQWCMGELKAKFHKYGAGEWGITASDTAHGYEGWGGPPAQGQIDGSVVPAAVAGSLAFEPRICLDTLEHMRRYWSSAYRKYGFVDCFNPNNRWEDTDCLGIDVGPSVLMAENCRTGFIWKTFMSCPEAGVALKAAHFRPVAPGKSVPTTSLFATEAISLNAASGG